MRESKQQDKAWVVFALAAWLFVAYFGTGFVPKLFTDGLGGVAKIPKMQYAVFSTGGGVLVGLAIIFALGWQTRFKKTIAGEWLMLAASGGCTAVVIVTTTLMYSFHGLSVMIAQVIMRGSIILIMLGIDADLIRRGISKKRVSGLEYLGVAVAVLAVSTALFAPGKPGEDKFNFFKSFEPVFVLGAYCAAYAVRLYIQQYWKHEKGAEQDNAAYFAVEQLFAVATFVLVAGFLLVSNSSDPRIVDAKFALHHWNWRAMASGVFFGLVAVPSVFLMMLAGRTGIFGALVNRVTTLIAGTLSTVAIALAFGKDLPKFWDWVSFTLLIVTMGILVKAAQSGTRPSILRSGFARPAA